MSNYDNNMQVILEKVVSDKEKAPALRVKVEMNGVKYEAGLWPWNHKDGTPVTDNNGNGKYLGKLKVDDYQPDSPQQSHAPVGAGDIDDDIPF